MIRPDNLGGIGTTKLSGSTRVYIYKMFHHELRARPNAKNFRQRVCERIKPRNTDCDRKVGVMAPLNQKGNAEVRIRDADVRQDVVGVRMLRD